MRLEPPAFAATALKTLPAFIVALFAVTFDPTAAIQVTEVSFPNATQHGFTVAWAYRLNGYNASRLEGFALVVSSIYDFEVISRELPPDRTAYATPWVESGTTYHVCVAPRLAGAAGNRTCGFVTTRFDPWDLKGQMACYIGVALLLVFVALVGWDVCHPRAPSGGERREAIRKNTVGDMPADLALRDSPADLTRSNIELTDNMHI